MHRVICPKCNDNDTEGWRIHYHQDLQRIRGIWMILIELECKKCGNMISEDNLKGLQELAEEIAFIDDSNPPILKMILGFAGEDCGNQDMVTEEKQ